MEVYKPGYTGLYYFDTFTFTTLGTSGHRGPDSSKGYANAPWREGDFSIVDGQQKWTVPTTGTYQITAAGAYGATPGRIVSGEVDLNEGQVLTMLVGQQPTPLTANVVDGTTVGGGGGTFVSTDEKLLMVASGGDGNGGSAASFSPYGDGNGKNGGGYLSNGLATNATFKFLTPEAYVNGGFGTVFPTGIVPEEGGFGGGQAPVTSGISGGGGYTGSPGDGVSGATCYADPTVTMTDLGAASNSAGYVTVSLIDPPPLKQTWSWSPNFVDTTLRGPWQNVNWSDELQQFLSIMGTSDDGLNWNNAATLLGIFTGVYPTNPVFCTAYSPSLGIYVGIGFDFSVFQVFFRYSYDKVTWQNSATNATSNNGKIIWSKDFNLFIAIDGTKIYSSDDGINWTQRYSGFYSIYQIVYSSSIPRVVTNVAYSDDGINWTSYVSKWDTVSWSPTLALFFATTSTSCKYSSDGITWSSSGVNLPTANWRTSIWSEQNSLFSILSSTQAAYSSDGLYWGVTSHEASTTIYDVAFSPANGVYVVAGELSEGYLVSIGGIYWVKPVPVEPVTRVAAWAPDKGIILMSDVASYKSSDGISWNLSISKEFFNIIYSDGLGIFVCTEYPQGNVYYSYDGSNFVDSNFTFSSTLYQKKRITWSKQLGMFSGKAYSRDGINWTFSSIDALSVVWCPEQKRFVALANIGGNNPTSTNSYYSSDGINWTYGSNLGTVYEIITQMAWSPTLHRFVVACKIYNTSNYVNLYSNDGINWSQSISINGLPPSLFWIPELQIFMSTGIYSYDGINWINVSIPSFLPIIWTPELKKIVCEAGYSEVTKTF